MLITALTAGFLLQAATPLSRQERAIGSYADAHRAEAIALLERIVNINSGTLNLAGVRQVGDLPRAEFDRIGFTTRWIDGAPFKRAAIFLHRLGRPAPRA
ncbi:MAG: hypothetical protein ACKVZ0_10050 [Gemmatimonadales bacterium]